MKFCTAINCMDGRIQLPVIQYLCKRFSVEWVDSITEPSPNLILSEKKDNLLVQTILRRLDISVNKHKSVGIAIIGHYDCAGNPATREDQVNQIQKSIEMIGQYYPDIEIIGLWVDGKWEVREIKS